MSDSYTPVTLESFGVPDSVTVNLHTPYGRTLSVRLVPLTCSQWDEIGAEVETPKEPAQKNPATMAVWRKHAAAAEEERNYRRVIFALELGGNPMPGATLAEKAKNWRKTADRGLTMSLYRFLAEAAEGDRARVIDAADTFQPDDDGDYEDVQP